MYIRNCVVARQNARAVSQGVHEGLGKEIDEGADKEANAEISRWKDKEKDGESDEQPDKVLDEELDGDLNGERVGKLVGKLNRGLANSEIVPLFNLYRLNRLAQRGHKILGAVKKQCESLKAPSVIAVTESYLLLEYIQGVPLGSWNRTSLSSQRRRKLLEGLASFYCMLWNTKIETENPGRSYRDWLTDEVDKGLSRSLKQNDGRWGDPLSFLLRRTLVDSDCFQIEDRGWLVRHGDMNAWNVIVDEDGFAGVVDWDTAQVVPAAAAIQHPLFLADIPGWYNDDVPSDQTFEQDREYLEDTIENLHHDPVEATKVRTLLRTSFQRQFLELSLRNRRINQEYIKTEVPKLEYSESLARSHMEEFLSHHHDMRNHPSVIDLEDRMHRKGLSSDYVLP
ncbi:hypothetical protein CAC42_3658 [Sphaceloma murrayae]|uniref:Aminoglycoside phosphotransferase domain-containing protein n=1 Tax=Sphaceloma murrayae TaxID=2082308 RepID=A0A2K1QPQ3_9PEZI|nr:hypothetical protein CAC42_3658 [Sphaceloma murrayae]